MGNTKNDGMMDEREALLELEYLLTQLQRGESIRDVDGMTVRALKTAITALTLRLPENQ